MNQLSKLLLVESGIENSKSGIFPGVKIHIQQLRFVLISSFILLTEQQMVTLTAKQILLMMKIARRKDLKVQITKQNATKHTQVKDSVLIHQKWG